MTAQPSIDISYSAINESLLGELELSVEKYIRSIPQHVVAIRDTFVQNWNDLIQINRNKELPGERTSRTAYITRSKEIKDKVYRSLKEYTFELYKKDFESLKSISEKTDEKETELLEYLNSLPGDQSKFINLFKEITKAHSKNVDFRNKAFKIFRRELVFKQIELEEELQSNEQKLIKAQKHTEREVDKVRVDLSRKLVDFENENLRLTAEVDILTRSNNKQSNLITELNNKLEDYQTGDDNKTLLELERTKTELEEANNEIEDQKTQLSNIQDTIDRVKEEASDKISQLNHSYSVLYSEHEALKAASQTSDEENSQLSITNKDLSKQLETSKTTSKKEIESLIAEKQNLASKISTIQSNLTLKESEIQDLTSKLQQLTIKTAITGTMPNTNPTPGSSSSNTGNTTPAAGSSSTDNTPVTKGHLRELYSHDERKSIPVFKGKRGEQLQLVKRSRKSSSKRRMERN